MPRPFSALVLVAVLLLIAGFVAGPGPSAWAGRLRAAGTAATLAVHGAAWAYLGATGRRVEGRARSSGMPEWVGAQAEKNLRKAAAAGVIGLPLALLAGWPGPEVLRTAVVAANLAYQLGAFAGESAMVAAQARLIRDVDAWPDTA